MGRGKRTTPSVITSNKKRQLKYNVKLTRFQVTMLPQKSVIYSDCLSGVLIIQPKKRVCLTVLSSVVWLYNISPHYLINGMIFGKECVLNMKCVF
jgi:hypothetical protein